jgi:endonuclease YncB( thermonuclease family)
MPFHLTPLRATVYGVLSAAIIGFAPAFAAPSITGRAYVVDGDTIKVDGTTVRLHGIDAPEAGQSCAAASGGAWACGYAATAALARLIDGREVSCRHVTFDKYHRVVGHCVAGDLDVNAEMVRGGHAWAFVKYSSDFIAVEQEARAARSGIWQAETQPAWDFRAERWQAAEQGAPEPGCAIKGNVNAKGERIYHMPWQPYYTNVKMEAGKGKQWFCTEADALAAGWRPAGTR